MKLSRLLSEWTQKLRANEVLLMRQICQRTFLLLTIHITISFFQLISSRIISVIVVPNMRKALLDWTNPVVITY